MRFLICVVWAVLLAGCASTPPLGGSAVTVVPGELPPPTAADIAGEVRPYQIGPYDTLIVDVFGIEGLDEREVQVDPAGNISFPLVGTIHAQGLTPAALEAALAAQLRAGYIRDPQVSVNLKETVSQVFTIDGQVREPGLYPVLGHMTLERAVARAKGTTEFAELDDVVVFRTVNDQKMAALYNLEAIRRGAYEDPEIFANDIVIVGDSQARRLFKDFLQIVPLLTTPLVVLLRN